MQTREITRNLVVIILIGAVLVGCSQSSTIPTIEPTSAPLVLSDGLDRSVSFEEPAQKIISIAPSNTEILFAIGAGSQVIGRDEFSDYPEEAKQIESIGGGFGAYDMEKIVALKPDLVLASQLTPAEQVEAFEKLGLKVYLLANPQDIEGMFENLEVIGQITGKETEAAALSEQLKARVATVDQKLANAENQPVVFYQIDSTDQNAPWTAGKGSFIDTLITRSGGNNLGAKLVDAYAQVSIEQLLIDQPEVIIVGDYTWGGITAEDVLSRESWAGLEAVKNAKVFIFDDNLVSRPGPRLVDGLEALAALLHPELFE